MQALGWTVYFSNEKIDISHILEFLKKKFVSPGMHLPRVVHLPITRVDRSLGFAQSLLEASRRISNHDGKTKYLIYLQEDFFLPVSV